jgi:hypothetical protein
MDSMALKFLLRWEYKRRLGQYDGAKKSEPSPYHDSAQASGVGALAALANLRAFGELVLGLS